jgi:MFS family permease
MKSTALIHFYEKNERYISPLTVLAGFTWDNLTLQRIDLWIDNLILVIYLVIAGTCILFLNAYFVGRLSGRFFDEAAGVAPFLMQFSFGGLFSAFVIFYSRSGSLAASWPFLAILVFLLLGNEVFRKRYARLAFQLCIFFFTVFSYLIFAVPLLLNNLGSMMFLISGFCSLVIISLFSLFLYFAAPQFVKQSWRWFLGGIVVIYLFFNFLYFTNIIPPVPLSLKDGGIAHAVSQIRFNYTAQIEKVPWYLFLDDFNPVFHWQPGQRVYCYASVFAPTEIKTEVFHRWSLFDENTKKWIEKTKVSYDIVGGKDGGYRGYSYKQNVQAGKWRVDVINERGQLLGRLNFEVVQSDSAPELKTVEY